MRTIVVVQAEEAGKQQQHNNSQYLEKIIDILQSSPLLAYRQVRVTCVLVCSLWVVTQFVERVTRQREKVLSQAPSTLRRRNLKTEVALWKCKKMFSVHATKKFENGGHALKTHQMFSVHPAPKKFENVTITGHFGYVFQENSGRKIA